MRGQLFGVEKSENRRISSHSLKSTSISWCSKFGLSEDAKALLAGHTSAVKNPQALYSRDLLSPVLRSFDQVLGAIRAGVFQPDRTRSGMVQLTEADWKSYGIQQSTVGVPATPVYNADLRAPGTPANAASKAPMTEEGASGFVNVKTEQAEGIGDIVEVESSPDGEACKKLIPLEIQPSSCISESSESSCEESSSEEEPDVSSGSLEVASRTSSLPESGWFINSKTLVLHCLRNPSTFRCGRPLTAQYISVRELNGYRCCRCFNV